MSNVYIRKITTFCDEHEGGCGASLTQTDFDAGYCTQCRTPTKKPRVFIRCECHGREFKREASYRYHVNTQRKQQATAIDKGD